MKENIENIQRSEICIELKISSVLSMSNTNQLHRCNLFSFLVDFFEKVMIMYICGTDYFDGVTL
jgi:hypothetical protein